MRCYLLLFIFRSFILIAVTKKLIPDKVPVTVDVSKVLVTFVVNQKATFEHLIKLEQTRSTSTEDGRSVTFELLKISFEEEAHIDDALERCTTNPALKQVFVIFSQYFDYLFIILFQIERISKFGASV